MKVTKLFLRQIILERVSEITVTLRNINWSALKCEINEYGEILAMQSTVRISLSL
jgi:hypothetical protein